MDTLTRKSKEIEKVLIGCPCCRYEHTSRCESCEGYSNYTARGETVVQTTDKEDTVSTHTTGAASGGAALCPNCKLAYKNGYNAALRWVLARMEDKT
jgi:hypothetical protein